MARRRREREPELDRQVSALVSMLRKRLMATWLWQALFVLAVIGSFVSHHLTVSEMMSRIRFVAMDSRDTFYLANLGTFDTARHIHAELAKMAAETIFSRNPDGFDSPERLERLFNPASTTALNKAAAKDADVFVLNRFTRSSRQGKSASSRWMTTRLSYRSRDRF